MVEWVAVAQNMTALANVIVFDKFQQMAWIAKNFLQWALARPNQLDNYWALLMKKLALGKITHVRFYAQF